jgi:hypothetical protein
LSIVAIAASMCSLICTEKQRGTNVSAAETPVQNSRPYLRLWRSHILQHNVLQILVLGWCPHSIVCSATSSTATSCRRLLQLLVLVFYYLIQQTKSREGIAVAQMKQLRYRHCLRTVQPVLLLQLLVFYRQVSFARCWHLRLTWYLVKNAGSCKDHPLPRFPTTPPTHTYLQFVSFLDSRFVPSTPKITKEYPMYHQFTVHATWRPQQPAQPIPRAPPFPCAIYQTFVAMLLPSSAFPAQAH